MNPQTHVEKSSTQGQGMPRFSESAPECSPVALGPCMCILWTQPLVAHQGRCETAHEQSESQVLSAGSISSPSRPICLHSVGQEPLKGDLVSASCQLQREPNVVLSASGRSKNYHPHPQLSCCSEEATLPTSLPLCGLC